MTREQLAILDRLTDQWVASVATAVRAGVSPREICAGSAGQIIALWDMSGLPPDEVVRMFSELRLATREPVGERQ